MNIKRWIAAAGVCLFFIGAGIAGNATAQTRVGLIDMGQLFKNHPVFSAELARLKTQADQFKADNEQLQQQIMQKAEGLNLYEKDSDEFRLREAELAKETASMEVEQRSKMREMLSREAALHFDTYVEITGIISQFCDETGVQLVLRFSKDEINAKDPNSVMQTVNGNVVYYSPSADITDAIIQRMMQSNRQASQAGRVNQ